MDIETQSGLSFKTRGVLYIFKSTLTAKKIQLLQLIVQLHDYLKTKFSRRQFHALIRHYSPTITPENIDCLFDQLDSNKNQFVFYEDLERVLDTIQQADNPVNQLNRKSKIINAKGNKQEQIEMRELIKFKDLLVSVEGYAEMVGLFCGEDDMLGKTEVHEMMNNVEYGGDREIVMKRIFRQKGKLAVKEFLSALGLGIVMNKPKTAQKPKNKPIQQKIYSEFINDQRKSRLRIPHIISQDKFQSEKDEIPTQISASIHMKLEQVPLPLQPYFNYGSELEKAFSIFAEQYIKNNIIYVDEQNPTCSKASRYLHLMEKDMRYELFEVAPSLIFRDKTRKGLGAMLEPKDIIQGNIGDCYFLSAIAAIVESYPELVYRLFVLEKNPSHLYGVKLFIDGVWRTIPLDLCFPVNHHGTFCGAQPHHNSIWVMLLEKAWAKVYLSYDNIHAGHNQQGLLAISGAPVICVSTEKPGFCQKIVSEFGKGSIITCATSKDVGQLTQNQQERLGIFSGHAYTLMKVYEKLSYKDGSITLFKVRNPWGRKGWTGDWSYSSKSWTPQLRKKLGYEVDPKDGTFFMSIGDFGVYFDHINISKVNLAYRHSYITNKTNRFDFCYNKMKIQQAGSYFFTLYQQNDRKFKRTTANYEKSKSWLMLAKIVEKSSNGQITKLEAIVAKAQARNNNTIQTHNLNVGEYILISKVTWRFWDEHQYNITAYGVDKVKFSSACEVTPHVMNLFITNRAEFISNLNEGKVSIYDNTNISKRYYFSIEDGIGFISITNFDNFKFETKISFGKFNGLNVILPYFIPLDIVVKPLETETVCFVVDPEGFNYSMSQKYYIKSR